jgi:hypothetical protein
MAVTSTSTEQAERTEKRRKRYRRSLLSHEATTYHPGMVSIEQVIGEKNIAEVMARISEDALAGCKKSQLWIADRVTPPLKASHAPTPFEFDATSLESACKSVVIALAAGKIPPDIAESILRTLSACANIGQVANVTKRLAELEDRIAKQSNPAGYHRFAAPQPDHPVPPATIPARANRNV